jgi:serine/threonine protein kinase
VASEKTIGSYRITGLIGRGGMGVVYRGHHLQLPREVAIKSIDARNREALTRLQHRFEKEAFVQSQLDHPGIVKVYDYIVDERAYYIVMEYVEGRSLAQVLAQGTKPLAVNRALDFFEQMLAAISYAHEFVYRDRDDSMHRGLVHRDLKPANILITPEGNVKITDFGIVKLVGADATDTLGDSYGSPEYVSPEQAEGLTVDQRSDIYSLGIILYEMLTGTPPFWNKTGTLSHTDIVRMHIERAPQPPSERDAQVTPEIEAIILRALEKNPERRFATAQEFLQAVRRMRGLGETFKQQQAGLGPTAELGHEATDSQQDISITSSARESYVTQPIGVTVCPMCGASVSPGDEKCGTCGEELDSSSATVKLTRQEAALLRQKKTRDIWTAVTIFAFMLIFLAVFYARRRAPTLTQQSQQQLQQPPPAGAIKPTPLPPSTALVELRPASVEVDSSFDGYTSAPLIDGEVDVRRISAMRYNQGNWASAETQGPHWITLTFDNAVQVAAVYVYWGFDRNRYMPSRRVELQLPDETGEWRTINSLEPGNDHDRIAFDFAPVKTNRVRIFQPVQQGPTNRPFVMWVREVKVFGVAEESAAP